MKLQEICEEALSDKVYNELISKLRFNQSLLDKVEDLFIKGPSSSTGQSSAEVKTLKQSSEDAIYLQFLQLYKLMKKLNAETFLENVAEMCHDPTDIDFESDVQYLPEFE